MYHLLTFWCQIDLGLALDCRGWNIGNEVKLLWWNIPNFNRGAIEGQRVQNVVTELQPLTLATDVNLDLCLYLCPSLSAG